MSKRARTSREQTKHDRKVKQIANSYRQRGYQVRADDVSGFTDPQSYHGRVPDVVAKKDGHTTLVEVETESSRGTTRSKKQHQQFKSWAGRKTNRHFRREVI